MFGHRVDANILLYIILLVDMIEYGQLCVDVLRLETRRGVDLGMDSEDRDFLGSSICIGKRRLMHLVSLHQMWKHASTDTKSHDTTSLQLWIYERLYPVDLPW